MNLFQILLSLAKKRKNRAQTLCSSGVDHPLVFLKKNKNKETSEDHLYGVL